MEIYYLFILICSIIAIHNIRINKISDSYKFNSLAITLIIILTFIPSIIPLIIKGKLIFENIIQTLLYKLFLKIYIVFIKNKGLYFLLGASKSTSIHMFPKILNSCDS
jgi:hypothetical protein